MVENTRRMVQFVQNASPYLAGEKAAFPATSAQRYVDRRLAVYCDGLGGGLSENALPTSAAEAARARAGERTVFDESEVFDHVGQGEGDANDGDDESGDGDDESSADEGNASEDKSAKRKAAKSKKRKRVKA